MPINPAFPSLHDLKPPGEQGTLRGLLGIGTFNPGKIEHARQLQSVESGIMQGVYGDEDIAAFAQKNPQAAPFLQQAIQKRNIFQRNFQPGVQASPELAPIVGGLYAGQEATGRPGPVSQEAESIALQGKQPVNNLQGAVNELLRAGQVDEARKLMAASQERRPQQPNALKFAIRAEGYHPDTPLEILPPVVAERALARTMTPIAAQTGLGTRFVSRGGVPGEGEIPGFIPKVERPPESVKDALRSNESQLFKIRNALVGLDPNATKEQKEALKQQGIKHDPDATGFKGYLPSWALNRMYSSGTDLRAIIGDLSSMTIKDRSGAAVTAAEFPRLKPFIPDATDDPVTVRKKLAGFHRELSKLNTDIRAGYTFDQGFVPLPAKQDAQLTAQPSAAQKPAGMSAENWNELQRLRQKQSGR